VVTAPRFYFRNAQNPVENRVFGGLTVGAQCLA
jgi:hypothetical protein